MNRRHLGIGLWAAGIFTFAVGCASSTREAYYWNHTLIEGMTNTETMTETMPENTRSHRRVVEQDAKALLDDIDMATYRDRPTRLTRWAEQ